VRALLLLALLASPADARCFSIWHYKEPQRCGTINRPPVERTVQRATVPAMAPPQAPGPSFDIPLPDPDPATTALKAQLQ
jgi:hypothetical protein